MHTICALVAEDECHFAALSLAPESGEIESCISDSSVDSFLVTCVNLDLFLFHGLDAFDTSLFRHLLVDDLLLLGRYLEGFSIGIRIDSLVFRYECGPLRPRR